MIKPKQPPFSPIPWLLQPPAVPQCSRDAVRKNNPTPLQFQDLHADCRIFYTVPTVYNFENLWNYVIDAMWRNPSLCIAVSASPFAPSTASNTPAAAPGTLSERSADDEAEDEDSNQNISPLEDGALIPASTSQCTVCANARETCTQLPYCNCGQRAFYSDCRRVCAGPGDCSRSSFCTRSRGQRGFCQENQDVINARGCPAQSRGRQSNTLVARSAASGVGRGPYEFPTSGRRPATNRGRGGIPNGGSVAPRSSSFGAGGMVNYAFGRGA